MRPAYLLACLMLFLAGSLRAQTSPIEKISLEHGLSQGMIFDILQTRDGFLWVATKDGLNRYDGNNFKVYSNDPFNPHSMGENTAYSLFEDSRGLLWIGLENKGVDVFDPKTEQFHHFLLDIGGRRFSEITPTTIIFETPDGAIWLGQSRAGLIRIGVPESWKNGLPREAELQALVPPQHIPLPYEETTGGENVLIAKYLKAGAVLTVTNRSQYLINWKTFGVQETTDHFWGQETGGVSVEEEEPDIWFHRYVDATRKHQIWLIRQGRLIPVTTPDEPFVWMRFTPGKAGHTWFSNSNKIWDLSPGEMIDFSKPDLMVDVPPSVMMMDRTGNFWIGTIGYGLRKLSPVVKKFHTGASGLTIHGLWYGAGQYFAKQLFSINRLDPVSGKLEEKSAFPSAPERQISLLFDPEGGFTWMVSKIPETTTGVLLRYKNNQYGQAEKRYEFNATLTIFDPALRTHDGRIWIASDDCRLICFDPSNEQFSYFSYQQLNDGNKGSIQPIAMAEDGNHQIWVGTQLGLVRFNPNQQNAPFSILKAEVANPDGLNNNSVACVLPDPADPSNTLWIGTKGGGINVMDISSGRCRHITTNEGLLNNVVYGILPGNKSNEFWCSTNRGLAKIKVNPVARQDEPWISKITTFTATLGLQDNEFNTYAYCKTETGELVFGGVNGLNRFLPQELQLDTTPPPIYLVGLEINHQKADFKKPESPLAGPLSYTSSLALNYNQNNLSFEFAALDYTDPSKNRYRYRLEGLEKEWVESGNLRFAHYSHLAPGRYVLHVQGNNGESGWAEVHPLVIIIYPPWYRSNAAYLVYLLALAWAAWRLYKFQIGRVKEREELAFEQREKERVQALERLKTNFFSNITHEFRTPLTLMIEPLRRALNKVKEPDVQENLRLAESNSRRLLALVNQLMDMAKLEGGQMTIEMRRGDLVGTVREIFERFLPHAEKKGIKLSLKPFDKKWSDFSFDAGKVEMVLSNLLSNAIKFTPPGGKVDLLCTCAEREGLGAVAEMSVRDTGIGIPSHAQGKVFDRFFQVDPEESGRTGEGTGIGLALSKELAELMGGGISLLSEPGVGSTFTFILPIKNEPAPAHTSEDLESGKKPETPIALRQDAMVLVVEDNPELRHFIKSSMGPEWKVVEAADGEEGIKKAIELLPDIVLTDVMMPHKDGFEVCNELKTQSLTAHIPIIMLTAKTGMEAKLRGLRRGADDYLTKPFSPEELLVRMENLVAQRRKLQQIYGRQLSTVNTADAVEAPAEFLSKPDRDFLQQCYQLLDEHLDDDTLGVEEMAQKLFISRMQLHRKLKAISNQTPIDFIRNYRLERAMVFLKKKEGNVSEVSRMVGFVNEKHFSTVFKEHFGKSPSEV